MGACQSSANAVSVTEEQVKLQFRRKNMSEWTVIDVKHWLSFVCDGEFKSLAPVFSKNDINGQRLKNITDQEIGKLIKNSFTAARFKLIRMAQLTVLEDDEYQNQYHNEYDGDLCNNDRPRRDRGKPEHSVFLKRSLLSPPQAKLLVAGYVHQVESQENFVLDYPIPAGIINIIIHYSFKARFILN